jgi:phosphoserine phosphatase RsbU/P
VTKLPESILSPAAPLSQADELLASQAELADLVENLSSTTEEMVQVVDRQSGRINELEAEVETLRAELALRKKRDETLKYFMQQFDEEQRLAARLQQDFLPKVLPQLGPVHVSCLFRPASYVSGDFYDVMRLDETHIGFFIADAVGHGMPAALLSMYIKRALVTKEITLTGYRLLEPGESLRLINQALIEQNLSAATFATALYGYINTETLEVTFARAGHPAPVILTAEGGLETLEAEGSLLGVFPDETFTNGRTLLRPGDRLLLFTDGIEVAFSSDQTLDTLQWRSELLSRAPLSGQDLLTDLARKLDEESGSLTPKDDLTIIAVEVK